MNSVVRKLLSLVQILRRRGAPSSVPPVDWHSADLLFLQWLSFSGLLLFASYMMWRANVWGVLVNSDPTGITLMIVGVFTLSTLWVGVRAVTLARERRALDAWRQAALSKFGVPAMPDAPQCHVHHYLSALFEKARHGERDNAQLTEVLAERLHGPSESAWWVNGIQIKLGLLGKVIGFSILAIQLSQVQNFDASQSATLLKTLTGGLGIALLTTAVGLLANMLLGVQLVKMDRCADNILADALEFAETRLPLLTRGEAQADQHPQHHYQAHRHPRQELA